MAVLTAKFRGIPPHLRHRRRRHHRRHPGMHPRMKLPIAMRTKLGYLDALGADDDEPTTLPELADYDGLGAPEDEPKTTFGHAKPTRQGATGIEAIDRLIFDVQDAVDDLKMYANITTVASVFSTLGVAYLVYKAARK